MLIFPICIYTYPSLGMGLLNVIESMSSKPLYIHIFAAYGRWTKLYYVEYELYEDLEQHMEGVFPHN